MYTGPLPAGPAAALHDPPPSNPGPGPAAAPLPPVAVRFRLPEAPALGENVMVGAWRPSGALWVDGAPQEGWAVERGQNWLLAAPRLTSRPPLVHRVPTEEGELALGFKGYLLDPGLHQWSPAESLARYWSPNRLVQTHNGIFATAVVSGGGRSLHLVSDAFGISPLYVRQQGDLVLFATSARYLTLPGDRIDDIAAAWLCLNEQMVDDRSLVAGVSRVPAGTVLHFSTSGLERRPWFDLARLPEGTAPLDAAAVGRCEEAFQAAMGKVLSLGIGEVMLPLSSGDDSRRVLSGLLHHRADFSALTVRVGHSVGRELRDYDAHNVSPIVHHYSIRHRTLDLPSPADSLAYELDRQRLTARETSEHQWYMSVAHALPSTPAVMLDGAGGDVFGNTGFGEQALYFGDFAARLHGAVQHTFRSELCPSAVSRALPAREELADDLARFLGALPDTPNFADFAFLQVRTRRGPAFKQQTLKPPHVVTACPFFDLDHVGVTMACSPVDKLAQTIQSRCLQAFWPELFAFGGSRRQKAYAVMSMPEESRRMRAVARGLLRQGGWNWSAPPLSGLPLEKRLRLGLASLSGRRAEREFWLIQWLAGVAAVTREQPVWEVVSQ